MPLITDEQSLESATYTDSNIKLRTWDESFGNLYVYQEVCGHFGRVVGIVRAPSWEEAYECVVDEIMDDADEDILKDIMAEPDYNEDEGLPEGYHYRGNGVPANDELNSDIACEELNGNSLDMLTPELLESLKITLYIEDNV